MFDFLHRNRCPLCRSKLPKDKSGLAEVRIDSDDGVKVISVCDDCARFFDKSADIFLQRHRENYNIADEDEFEPDEQ